MKRFHKVSGNSDHAGKGSAVKVHNSVTVSRDAKNGNWLLYNFGNDRYADDSTMYVYAKNIESLKTDLEEHSDRMISYCNSACFLNNDKTQLLVSPKQKCQIKVGSSFISATSILILILQPCRI